MIINHNRDKLLNLIVYFDKNTKRCGKTKLFKLLFFSDFQSFKETGKSITGLKYFTWPHGPAPVELASEFKKPSEDFQKSFSVTKSDNSDRLNIIPRKDIKFDDKHFTKKELAIISNIAYIYKEASGGDMEEVSHLKNSPWKKTLDSKGENKFIDYLLALDNDKSSLTIEQYREIKEANDAMDTILALCAEAK